MYHPVVIGHNISTLTCSLHDDCKSANIPPFTPTYHTISECEHSVRHLNLTREIDDSGTIRVLRDFTVDEIQWMMNERFLCRLDFHYFISRYCYIKNPFDQIVRFSPWVSQQILFDIVAQMNLDEIAVMIQALKARQLGISRAVSLLILHRIIFYPHVNALIGSSTPSKTLKLLDMLEFTMDRLPFWMPPTTTARQRNGEGGFLEFGGMDTGLTLQHGAQMSGIARGTTPTVGHLTELAEFAHPESIVDASLLRAMHDSPRTFLVLEGTAEGQFNWWHNKWLSAKEGWPEKRSRLRPMFLPWFVGSDIYPTPAWLKAHPVPENYRPDPYVIKHADKAAEYVRSDELLCKYLGDDWTMPVEQKWFYEAEWWQAKRENRLNTFLQEMPSSDDEAFQSSNISVFEAEVITEYKSRVKAPIGVYGLIGPDDEVPGRLQPHSTLIDPTRPIIEIPCQWGNYRPIIYKLIPLRWGGYSTDSGLDKIYLWEMPIPGEIYGLGVDTSYGVQKDRTTIEIIRKGNIYRPAAQVAEFCSGKVNAMDAVPFCMALGTLFSVESNDIDQNFKRQCRAAIECKGNGDQTQLQMRFRGWSNFHPWTRIDNKQLDQSRYNKIGIYTTEWFKAGMMEFMIKMIRDAEIDIRSPFFINEMQSLESDWERRSLNAAFGSHDDRFMAMGFIVISLYQWERGKTGTFSSTRPPSIDRKPNPDEPRRYATARMNIQEMPYAVE